MSLYDDVAIGIDPKETSHGWSSGIKLLQSQLKLKKATLTQPKREQLRKLNPALNSGAAAKSKKENEVLPERDTSSLAPFLQEITQITTSPTLSPPQKENKQPEKPLYVAGDPDWLAAGEYDPLKPNDYERCVRELREKRDKEEDERRKRRREERKRRGEDEDRDDEPPRHRGGAAIAPPSSLQETSNSNGNGLSSAEKGLVVAAKIMAKFGYREGQGLGKSEQGMSTALSVEKTSKRGGRIIHEKDLPTPAAPSSPPSNSNFFMHPPPAPAQNLFPTTPAAPKKEETITEIVKNPSKVVLLRNMVGPGEVDDDLEPEVKEECQTKYGEVNKVVIYEIPNQTPDEAVRIFVEFKKIEHAFKAVIDLNGRFFGGRQVKAGFYEIEMFQRYELNE